MGVRAALVMVVLAAGVVQARAQEADDKPWAAGVGAEDRARALELFREGNQLFERSQYTEALVRYREAISHWDHPSIRFNIAVSLIRLERWVEASENIGPALRFGAAPFDRPELYEEGVNYQKLLVGRLAQLTVRCQEAGARVVLDGGELLTCPGSITRTLDPGEHLLVGSKTGFLTATRSLVLLPGKPTTVDIELLRLDQAGVRVRRWAPWKPWAVVGAGGLIALIGVPLAIAARSNMERYDDGIAAACPTGCETVPPGLQDLEDRARMEDRLAIGAFVAGGLTVAGGLVLVLLNQPRLVAPSESAPGVTFTGTGIRFAARF